MIIQRNRNGLKDIEESVDYKILNILTQDEHNKLITDGMGNVCFIGNTEKYRKVIWKDLLTGQDSDDISARMKYVYNESSPQFRGCLVCDEPLGEDETIVYDMAELKNIDKDFSTFMFMITDTSLLNDIKNNYNGNEIYDSQDKYNGFSRVRINIQDSHMWLYIEKFAESLVTENRSGWEFSGDNCYAAYCNANKNVIANGKIIKFREGSVDRLMVICGAHESTDAAMSLKNCAHILSRYGYMYIEPFACSEVNTENLIVEIIANRQLPLEIYDEDQKLWAAFERGALKKYSDMQNIKLRICVETGDYVRNIAIKNI